MTGVRSERLAAFASGNTSFPESVFSEARRSILNGIATGLAGSADPETLPALRIAERFAAGEECSLIGRPMKMDVLGAAFVNALTINVHDFDDTHPETILHPTAPVLPVLLALSEVMPVTGRSLLEVFIIGVEVECRIANAVSPGHYRRGWHITSTCGIFGAAAAAGRLLKLDAAGVIAAFGIASAQASGLVETLGTMAKSVGVGNAARNGLQAALLARDGMRGPSHPLEGPRGFLNVTCDSQRSEELDEGLSERWEILRNTYKPYPCGVVLNPVIEAALHLACEKGFLAEAVEKAVVTGHPLLAERTDRPDISTGREAQVSAQHAVAVSLLRKKAGLAQFSDAEVANVETRALRERVVVAQDPSLPVGAARLDLALSNGRKASHVVMTAWGDSERPLSDADINKKLFDLASECAPTIDPALVAERISQLSSAENAASLAHALST